MTSRGSSPGTAPAAGADAAHDDEAAGAVPARTRRLLLLASVFVVAHCGLLYELIAGAVSSYVLGDAVTQFSLVIGVFLCAMGLGSYAAKFVKTDLLYRFVTIEIWLGLLGGTSSVSMFAVSALAPGLFPVFFYSLCVALGGLVGLEIPLLVRLLRKSHDEGAAISDVLALDYFGALVASILFPFVVLPYVGLSRASVVFGLMNLAVAALGVRLLARRKRFVLTNVAFAGALLVAVFFYSSSMVGFFEDMLYQDDVIFARSTTYQRIVMTRWRDDVRLYIDGHIQFSSVDEARYHESLVIPAMESFPRPRAVLVLGGGDGMAVREVLAYPTVQTVTLVDLDPVMTELGRSRPELVALNRGSLSSPKVRVVNDDAMHFVRDSSEFYDVIVVDLPDPHAPALAKLYSTAFYAMLARRLSARGVMVTQATSPFFAPEAFWCVVSTMRAAIPEEGTIAPLHVYAYHVHVPSFGEWGFVMGSKAPVDVSELEPSVSTSFLNREALQSMFAFGRDLRPPEGIEVNRLDHPVLSTYYARGWKRHNK